MKQECSTCHVRSGEGSSVKEHKTASRHAGTHIAAGGRHFRLVAQAVWSGAAGRPAAGEAGNRQCSIIAIHSTYREAVDKGGEEVFISAHGGVAGAVVSS